MSKKQTNPNQRPADWKPIDLSKVEAKSKQIISRLGNKATSTQQLEAIDKIIAEYIKTLYGEAKLDDKTAKTAQLITDKVKAEIEALLEEQNIANNIDNELNILQKNQDEILTLLKKFNTFIDKNDEKLKILQKKQDETSKISNANNVSKTSPKIVQAKNISTIKNNIKNNVSSTISKKSNSNIDNKKNISKDIDKYINITKKYITNFTKKTINVIKNTFKFITKTIKTIFNIAYKSIAIIIKSIKKIISVSLQLIVRLVKTIFLTIKTLTKTLLIGVVKTITGIFSGIKNIFLHPIQTLKNIVIGLGKTLFIIGKTIFYTVKTIFNVILFIGKSIYKLTAFILKTMFKTILLIAKTVFVVAKTVAKIMLSVLQILAKVILQLAISTLIKLFLQPISTILNLLIGALLFKAFGKKLFGWIFDTIAEYIVNIGNWLWTKIQEFFGYTKTAGMKFSEWVYNKIVIPFAQTIFNDEQIGKNKTLGDAFKERMPKWIVNAFNCAADLWTTHVSTPLQNFFRKLLGIPENMSFSKYLQIRFKLLLGIPLNTTFIEYITETIKELGKFLVSAFKSLISGQSPTKLFDAFKGKLKSMYSQDVLDNAALEVSLKDESVAQLLSNLNPNLSVNKLMSKKLDSMNKEQQTASDALSQYYKLQGSVSNTLLDAFGKYEANIFGMDIVLDHADYTEAVELIINNPNSAELYSDEARHIAKRLHNLMVRPFSEGVINSPREVYAELNTIKDSLREAFSSCGSVEMDQQVAFSFVCSGIQKWLEPYLKNDQLFYAHQNAYQRHVENKVRVKKYTDLGSVLSVPTFIPIQKISIAHSYNTDAFKSSSDAFIDLNEKRIVILREKMLNIKESKEYEAARDEVDRLTKELASAADDKTREELTKKLNNAKTELEKYDNNLAKYNDELRQIYDVVNQLLYTLEENSEKEEDKSRYRARTEKINSYGGGY